MKKIISLFLLCILFFTGCEKREEKQYVINEDAVMFRKIIEEVDSEKLTYFDGEENNNGTRIYEIMLQAESDGLGKYEKSFRNDGVGFMSGKSGLEGYVHYIFKFNPVAKEEEIERYKKYNYKGYFYSGSTIDVTLKKIRHTKDTIIGNDDDYFEYKIENMLYESEDIRWMSSIDYDFSEKRLLNENIYDMTYLEQFSDAEKIKKKTRKSVEKYLGKKTEELYKSCTEEDVYKLIIALSNETIKEVYS